MTPLSVGLQQAAAGKDIRSEVRPDPPTQLPCDASPRRALSFGRHLRPWLLSLLLSSKRPALFVLLCLSLGVVGVCSPDRRSARAGLAWLRSDVAGGGGLPLRAWAHRAVEEPKQGNSERRGQDVMDNDGIERRCPGTTTQSQAAVSCKRPNFMDLPVLHMRQQQNKRIYPRDKSFAILEPKYAAQRSNNEQRASPVSFTKQIYAHYLQVVLILFTLFHRLKARCIALSTASKKLFQALRTACSSATPTRDRIRTPSLSWLALASVWSACGRPPLCIPALGERDVRAALTLDGCTRLCVCPRVAPLPRDECPPSQRIGFRRFLPSDFVSAPSEVAAQCHGGGRRRRTGAQADRRGTTIQRGQI